MRILLALLALLSSAAAHAADTWIAFETANFSVLSNASESTAQKTALEFEQVKAAYEKVWPWARLGRGRPLVVALKDERTFKQWTALKGGVSYVSYSVEGPDRQYLILRTDSRPGDVEVTPNYNLYRAYLQAVLSTSFERPLPLWLSNGLAQVLGNTTVVDKEIRVGRPVPWEFQRFNRDPAPLQRVLDAGLSSTFMTKDDQRTVFDAQCYVLVHYILFADKGAHGQQLSRFQELWRGGSSHDKAFTEAFGSVGAIENQLPTYATSKILSFARLQADARIDNERPPVRVLPPADVAGRMACVQVALGQPAEAQTAVRAARDADPRAPISYDAEGMLADHEKDKPRATQAYAQAVALGSKSAYSHYRAAQVAWRPEADSATLAVIHQRLEEAIGFEASYAAAHAFLAEVLAQEGDGPGALEHAKTAVNLAPGDGYSRVAAAQALQKLGRTDEAQKAAELGLRLADNDETRAYAERFLLYLKEVSRYEQDRAKNETLQKQTSACQQGDRAACTDLLPELEKSCAGKTASACRHLAGLYSGGSGLAKDPVKATEFYRQACAAGDRPACVENAWALARGDGVAKDQAAAVAELDGLCTEGFMPACTRLGFVYAASLKPGDRDKARKLFAQACSDGQEDACSAAKQMKP